MQVTSLPALFPKWLRSAVKQADRYTERSLREQIARGEVTLEAAVAKAPLASADTRRKWRRTQEALEAGWTVTA